MEWPNETLASALQESLFAMVRRVLLTVDFGSGRWIGSDDVEQAQAITQPPCDPKPGIDRVRMRKRVYRKQTEW